jgi:AraC-like DNA-binding protein
MLTTEQGAFTIGPETMTVIPAHVPARFEIQGDIWDMCWLLLPATLQWNQWMPETAEIRATSQALNVFHLSHVIDQERALGAAFRESSFEKLSHYIEMNLKAKLPEYEDRLASAFAQIEQSLHKPWTVADVARLTFYSEPHLYRLCRERFGKSPKQLIRELRIDRAKQLLEHTDWPLAELAGRLGFSDQFNFSNRFKKEVGLSPAKYRQKVLTLPQLE